MNFYNEYNQIIDHKNMERAEQLIAEEYIKDDYIVLELGARYGSVSCSINKKLQNKKNQVSVEPDFRVWGALERNKINNNCEFYVVNGFISKQKYNLTNIHNFYGYGTTFVEDKNSIIPSFTLEEIEEKYNLKFNALVADCEGYLEIFMDENPKLYDELKFITFECDYPEKCNYKKIIDNLIQKNFKCIQDGFHTIFIKE